MGDVGGSVNFSALGDIVGGDKITTITTTIQISVEAITQRPLVTTSPYRGLGPCTADSQSAARAPVVKVKRAHLTIFDLSH